MPPVDQNTRRWYRFSLRSVLIVFAVIALPLAWLAKERGQSRYEQHLAEQLRQQGFKTIMLAGPYDSWSLELWGSKKPQGRWRDLARRVLGERILLVYDPPDGFNDLTPLVGLSNLQGLHLRAPVRDPQPLAGFNKLVVLSIHDGAVSDLAPLAGLKDLEVLHLEGLEVTDLAPLAGLDKLRMLWLHTTHVNDLTPLDGLQNLETFVAHDSHVSKSEIAALQKALPNCRVTHEPRLATDYKKP